MLFRSVDMWSTGMMGSENADIPLGGSVLVIGIGAVGLSQPDSLHAVNDASSAGLHTRACADIVRR